MLLTEESIRRPYWNPTLAPSYLRPRQSQTRPSPFTRWRILLERILIVRELSSSSPDYVYQ